MSVSAAKRRIISFPWGLLTTRFRIPSRMKNCSMLVLQPDGVALRVIDDCRHGQDLPRKGSIKRELLIAVKVERSLTILDFGFDSALALIRPGTARKETIMGTVEAQVATGQDVKMG